MSVIENWKSKWTLSSEDVVLLEDARALFLLGLESLENLPKDCNKSAAQQISKIEVDLEKDENSLISVNYIVTLADGTMKHFGTTREMSFPSQEGKQLSIDK